MQGLQCRPFREDCFQVAKYARRVGEVPALAVPQLEAVKDPDAFEVTLRPNEVQPAEEFLVGTVRG